METAEDSVLAVMARVANAPVPDLRPRGVPDAVCRSIERAMAKDPAERPGSAAEFVAELEAATLQGTAAPPPSGSSRAFRRRSIRRSDPGGAHRARTSFVARVARRS